MRKTTGFNKKIFALLIREAKGDRSLKRFSQDCGISYVQLRKLSLCMQENPPGKAIILKLAQNSLGGIDYEDYLFAAGLLEIKQPEKEKPSREKLFMRKYSCLSQGQKKTLEDFLDFLSDKK